MARSGWLVSCGLLGGFGSGRGCLAVVSRWFAGGLRRLVGARGGWLVSCGLLADVRVDSRVVLRRLAVARGGS